MKKIVLLAVICVASLPVFSQSSFFTLGTQLFVDKSTGSSAFPSYTLNFYYRYNLKESDKTALSLGMPLSIGRGSLSSRTGTDINGNQVYTPTKRWFLLDVPVIFNFNWGAGSTKTEAARVSKRMGYFAGGGLAYHLGPVNKVLDNDVRDKNGPLYGAPKLRSAVGPVANAGFRMATGESLFIEFKLSYMRSLTKYSTDIYSMGMLLTH
jgi:hypothetical protein